MAAKYKTLKLTEGQIDKILRCLELGGAIHSAFAMHQDWQEDQPKERIQEVKKSGREFTEAATLLRQRASIRKP